MGERREEDWEELGGIGRNWEEFGGIWVDGRVLVSYYKKKKKEQEEEEEDSKDSFLQKLRFRRIEAENCDFGGKSSKTAISAELALLLFVDLEFLKLYNCDFGGKSSFKNCDFGGNGGKSLKYPKF